VSVARPLRFTFILVLAALGTGLAAVGGWRYARASAPVNGPIILISIDTLRADRLPAYGYKKIETPALDALAADGVVFERAYSHSPQTLPAHASLLTGRLPFETGVRDNVGFVLKPNERLLPQMLRERGFATGGIVSAYILRKETGIGQGFDFFDDGTLPASTEATAGQPLQRDGAEAAEIAERWLGQQESPRVFLFLHLYEPHKPYAPPPRYSGYEPYDGEIAYADEIVGGVIRYLKSHQLYDRSTIVVLSDHGEGLGDHGEQQHGLFVYEEAVRVPLIVKPAGSLGGGRRINDVVQHADLVPTILDLAKAPAPGNLHGRSLKALLDGTGRLEPEPVYSEALYGLYHFGWTGVTALTDGRYRYIQAPKEELYDLTTDAQEKHNLAEDQHATRQVLHDKLEKLVAGAVIPQSREVTEDERERFDALGYVGSHVAARGATGDDAIDPKDRSQTLEAYRQAAQLVTQTRLDAAIEVLQRLVSDNPMMADTWRQLGHVLERAGRLEQAARAYERSAGLMPEDASALLAAARSRFRLGRFEEAQRDAERALARASASAPATQVAAEEILARIAVARKDYDAARTHAENAERVDGSVPMGAFVEGLFSYSQGRHEDALLRLREAGTASRISSIQLMDLHYYTAETLGRLERWDESITEFKQELDAFPHNLAARVGLAMAYRAAERSEDAERILNELTSTTPTPEAYGLAARAWTMMGERRRAEALRAEGQQRFRADPSLKLLVRPR
jgi:choline-sulfatase